MTDYYAGDPHYFQMLWPGTITPTNPQYQWTQPTLATCSWCGCYHTAVCPRVKAIEYFPDGTIKRVEFHSP